MGKPKQLLFADIEKIAKEKLIADRELQRDIHYTITESIGLENKEQIIADFEQRGLKIPKDVLVKQVRPYHGNNTFRIKDTQCVYFFDEGWPCDKQPPYLKPENIIDSGWWAGRRDYSDNSKRHALEKLIKAETKITVSPFGLDAEGKLDLTIHKPAIIPITNIDTLNSALYLEDTTALNALKHINVPFNKPLYKANIQNGQIEMYNAVGHIWEKENKNIYLFNKNNKKHHLRDNKRLGK